jgi:hypothetical protein
MTETAGRPPYTKAVRWQGGGVECRFRLRLQWRLRLQLGLRSAVGGGYAV